MSIILQGSTSGSVTLQEPAVAGTTVLTLPATSGTILTSASSVSRSQLPTGSVLQVVSTTKSDQFSQSGGGNGVFHDITGLSVTITPTSATSKILILVYLSFSSSNNAEHLTARVVRGSSTLVGVGDVFGSRNQAMWAHGINHTDNSSRVLSGHHLDSPATTSATTYKVQGYNSSSTFYLNRTLAWSDSNHFTAGASAITVMEIAA